MQATFVDRESDFTIKQKPAFGVAGWTKNDAAVILNDKFDLWHVAADGSRAVRLTDGGAEEVRHRYLRLNPDEEWIDMDKPAYVSLFGIWTKKSGYARLGPGTPGAAVDQHLVWLDKSVQRSLAKAKDADVFVYTIESFSDSPDAFVGGLVGHSWGGFDAAFLATHSDLFAAAVAGAPITNLVSNYGNHHWSSGIAETDHIETGQQRMEVPLWEDLPAYVRNSAVFNVQSMRTPLMIEVGDIDGTVFWHQGVELYNIARRAKKDVVLLVYTGEDHGLRKKANQMDYHRRIQEWFGHFLKGEPAQAWITSGVSFLDRERELKLLKGKMRK